MASKISKPPACLRCRKNRVYCTKTRPRCKTCQKGHHQCIYDDGPRVRLPASYVASLRAKIAEYEALYSPRQDDLPSLTTSFNHMLISSKGTPRWLGNTAATAPLHQLNFATHLDITETPTFNEAKLHQPEFVALPPYPVAKSYFSAQHKMIGSIFSFVTEQEFEEHYHSHLDINSQMSRLRYCQVLMVMAFGRMYEINGYDNEDGPPGFAYFAQALQFLPEIHSEPSILFCRVLCLVGYFMQNLIRRDAAFIYLGIAQRMALTLALHEELPFDDMEKRRRTWWSIYSLDRIFCIKYGNPVTMHDEDIKIDLPSRQPHEPEFCSAVVLRHYTMLSQILSQIMDRIYKKTANDTTVQEIMRSLVTWEQNLPAQLRMLSTEVHSREAVSMYLHYYQCISMTARPLLFWVVKQRETIATQDWRQGLPQGTVSVVEMCINAAKDTIAIMSSAAPKNLVAVHGYMDGEHLFNATLVMVVVNTAFQHDDCNAASMQSGLSLLEMLANKGNRHIYKRHQMLLQLLNRKDNPENASPYEAALHNLDHVFPAESMTDLDQLNFQEAYAQTDIDIEAEMQHMSTFTQLEAEDPDEEPTDEPSLGQLPF